MDLRKLQRTIIDALEDVKAHDIEVFNTTEQTSLFDRVVIATGTSNRQTRALAAHVRDRIKAAGGNIIAVEGEDSGEWVLVDAGDAVVHIMQPAVRDYYNLEELWGSKKVRVKLGGESAAPAKAASKATKASAKPAKAPAKPSASATTKKLAPRSSAKPAAPRTSAGGATRRPAVGSAAKSTTASGRKSTVRSPSPAGQGAKAAAARRTPTRSRSRSAD